MFGAIKHNLMHLADFTGRDARPTFWYYVLFLVLVNVAISIAASIPMAGAMMNGALQATQSGAMDAADQNEVMASILPQMTEWIAFSIWISAATGAVMIALIAASFVRRAHDSGNSGYWVLLPIAAQISAIGLSIASIGRISAVMEGMANVDPAELPALLEQQQQFGLYGLIGWVPALAVIIFGVLPSTDGPNKYGDMSARF